jgi:hypothetical protein
MFKRTALLALVASAVVGLATLVSTSADARPHGGGHGHHRVVGGHGGHGMVRPGLVRRPGVIRHVHGHGRHLPRIHRHIHLRPRFGCWRHPWLCRPIVRPHFCWRHPWMCRRPIHVVRYGGYYPVAAAAIARPVAASCTCLRKTYLPNGAVLFQDVCTNESAINPPAQAAEAPQQ